MLKKLFLLATFFLAAPSVLFFSLIWSVSFVQDRVLGDSSILMPTTSSYIASAANEPSQGTAIKTADGVPVLIENYLKRYQSPLLPYAEFIVNSSRKNGIDPFLLVAIAQQESNLGKSSPEGCNNAWGWGIHAKGTKCFDSWEEAIETVALGIAKNYCAKGYCDDPCVMMKKYTPQSNGSWCFGINQFLQELKTGEF